MISQVVFRLVITPSFSQKALHYCTGASTKRHRRCFLYSLCGQLNEVWMRQGDLIGHYYDPSFFILTHQHCCNNITILDSKNPEQFDSGIPGATNDTYFNHLALQRRRIKIQKFNVAVYHDKPTTYCSLQGDGYNVVRNPLAGHPLVPEHRHP